MNPDLTIVLLGKTGVGKSASGNTILGRTEFQSKLSFRSLTTEISERTGSVLGKQISVVDTPGILDSKDTEKKIEDYCQDLLKSSRRCLFLVTLRVGRFTKEDQEAVKTAMKVLGGRGLEKSYLLFTGGDTLEDETLEEFIFAEGDEGQLPKVVQMIDGRYHLFDNQSDDEEQVRNLLLKSGHLKTDDQPDSPADISKEKRIVMLGLPGAGKSSSGNTILRSEKFKSAADFDSVSQKTTSASATVEGCKVTVVDTPGFTDKHLTPKKLYEQIMRSVVEASPGVHAFVIVVRVGRITEADLKLFELLPKLFEGDALKYSMVLFTHGDNLKGQSIEGLMKKNKRVSKLVSMCGGRYCVFDNRTKKSREQVRTFLSKIDEMVSTNGGQHYTDQMFRMAETFLREERNLVQSGASGGGDIKESAWKKMTHYIQNNKAVAAVVAVVAVVVVAAVVVAAVLAVAAVGATGTAVAAVAAGTEAVAGATGAGAVAGVAVAAAEAAVAVGAAAAAEAAVAVGAAAVAAEAAVAVGAGAAAAAAAAAAAEAAAVVVAAATVAATAAATEAALAVAAGAAAAAAVAAEAAVAATAAALVATAAAAAATDVALVAGVVAVVAVEGAVVGGYMLNSNDKEKKE